MRKLELGSLIGVNKPLDGFGDITSNINSMIQRLHKKADLQLKEQLTEAMSENADYNIFNYKVIPHYQMSYNDSTARCTFWYEIVYKGETCDNN